MKQTINIHQFRDAFNAIRPDNFSYDGLGALFDYLEQTEEDCGIELEFDVIAICCDFGEYKTREEAAKDYGIDADSLEDYTTVIEFDGGVIIQSF